MSTGPLSRRAVSGPEGRDEVVAAVLAAATVRFAESGPSRVTIRQIAEAANVNHALVHRHFNTKEELLRQVMRNFIPDAEDARDLGDSWPETVDLLFEPSSQHATWARMLAWLLLESDVEVALVDRFPMVDALIARVPADAADDEDARLLVAAVELFALGWHLFGDYVMEMVDLGHLDRQDVVHRMAELAARMGVDRPGD